MKLIVLALAAGTAVAECPNVSSSVATKAGQRKAAARERPARGSPRHLKHTKGTPRPRKPTPAPRGDPRPRHTNTPPETLMQIYKDVFGGNRHHHESYYVRSIAEHPNCPEELAVVMSTSENKNLQRAGFERLVAIKREKNRSAS